MPPQQSKSTLFAKHGPRLQKAHEAHKADETDFGNFIDLPAGIDRGVAQLTKCGFGIFKKGTNEGEWFFQAQGTIIEPVEFGGEKVAGRITKIGPEPVCDTPDAKGDRKTLEDHWEWVLNELRKLGVNTATTSAENIEQVCAALVKASPYFTFRTWRGQPSPEFPNPRVNQTWMGELKGYSRPSLPGAMKDTTAPPPTGSTGGALMRQAKANGSRGTTTVDGTGTNRTTATKLSAATPPPAKAPTPFDDQGDLDSLAQRATEDDEAAQDELKDYASRAGYTEEEVMGAATWQDVVSMIMHPRQSTNGAATVTTEETTAEEPAEEGSDEEGQEITLEVGQVWYFRPLGKDKKPGKKIEVEVMALDEEASTCTLRSVDDNKKSWKTVSWDRLESSPD